MRKKQYNYYRDQLLSFKEGEVEWKTLGEVAQYSKTRISFELLDEKNSYDLCQILSPKRPYAAPGASLYRGLKNLKQSDCILDFTNSYSGILAP